MPGLKERAKTLVELIDSAGFLFADRPIALDDKAKAIMTDEARGLLKALLPDLETVEPWGAAGAEQTVRTFAERANVKLGADCPASAHGADRPRHLARDFRRADRAGKGREPGAVARPGGKAAG